MRFSKWQGTGNDFVLLEVDAVPETAPDLARALCDRHYGVGADGLVFVLPGEKEKLGMRIFNPDGSEAEMCGNALRCVAKFAFTRRRVSSPSFGVETPAGVRFPEVLTGEGGVVGVRVDMGEPVLAREAIPVLGPPGTRVLDEELHLDGETFRFTAVSMGNPHCLIFVPRLEDFPVAELGPRIERHPLFPKRTNVEFVEVVTPEVLLVRVWERGAGETLACGTGACAAVVGGFLTGRCARRAEVKLPGGTLSVAWEEDNHVYLTGPAEEVFQGELSPYFWEAFVRGRRGREA